MTNTTPADGSPNGSPAFIDLPAMLASFSDRAVLANPALAELIVEFACWELELNEWSERRLPKRHSGFREWIKEGRALFDHRDELKAMAYALVSLD